jgi:hypothetical protein
MEIEDSTSRSDARYPRAPQYRHLLRARRPSEMFLRERMQLRTPPETNDEAPAGPGTGPAERGT